MTLYKTPLRAALLLSGLLCISLQQAAANSATTPEAGVPSPEPGHHLDALLQERNTAAEPVLMSPDPRLREQETGDTPDTSDQNDAEAAYVHEEHADDLFQQPLHRAFNTANRVAVPGPVSIDVAGQATLQLPSGFAFIPEPASRILLRAMGNPLPEHLQGMIFPLDSSEWFATLHYEDSGHIRDDDASTRQWHPDTLLAAIRAQHPDRQQVRYWTAAPQYDPAQHQLLWSLAVRDSNQPEGAAHGISYQTRTLGREGQVSLDLVTNPALAANLLPVAQTLLAALRFNPGQAYVDFNPGTDRLAGYGLATLITGTAPTPELPTLISGWFLKFWPLVLAGLLLLAGSGTLLYRFFREHRPADAAPVKPEATS
ncbi:MAG: DUF2167 domain-containing protein [Thiothrix sp.]|nr:DUF2167 domain-containing protein [Thiothrix sp.]HPQ96942.1 DUF2167 domain-containing protein [Thiolinea sp.]